MGALVLDDSTSVRLRIDAFPRADLGVAASVKTGLCGDGGGGLSGHAQY